MKNLFKWSSYLVAAALIFNVACSDDDEPAPDNTPQVEGEWVLATATLVDGNAQTTETAEDLTIANYPVSPITVGDIQNTSVVVGGVLAGAACDDPINNSAGFYLELAADGGLNFYCPLEDAVQSEGSWNLIDDNGVYTLALSVDIDGNGLTIPVTDIVVAADGSTFSGTAVGFPVPLDVAQPIGLTNLQFTTVDIVLTAK